MNSDEFNKWIKEGYEEIRRSQRRMDRHEAIREEFGTSAPLFKTDEKKQEIKQNQAPKPIQVAPQNRPKPVQVAPQNRPKPTLSANPKSTTLPTRPKATLSSLGAQRREIGQKRTEDLTLDEARSYHKYSNQIERELDERLKKTEKEKSLPKDPNVEAMDKTLTSWEKNKI